MHALLGWTVEELRVEANMAESSVTHHTMLQRSARREARLLLRGLDPSEVERTYSSYVRVTDLEYARINTMRTGYGQREIARRCDLPLEVVRAVVLAEEELDRVLADLALADLALADP